MSRPLAPIPPQVEDQVDDDRDVDDEEGNPDGGESAGDLVDLEWDERAGGDDDEVLGPVVAKDQAGALDRVEGGVEERAHLERVHRFQAERAFGF